MVVLPRRPHQRSRPRRRTARSGFDIAVLSQSPTFRRELGDGAQAAAGQSLRYLGAAFRASDEGSDGRGRGGRHAPRGASRGWRERAGDGRRAPRLGQGLGRSRVRSGSARKCRAAALALRTRGHIRHQACVVCDHRNEDLHWDELARSAPAAALIYAAAAASATSRTCSAMMRARTRPSRATRVMRRPRAKSKWSWTTRPRSSC